MWYLACNIIQAPTILFPNSDYFLRWLTGRSTNVIRIDSPIRYSNYDRLREHVDCENSRVSRISLGEVSVNKVRCKFRAASYLREIVVGLFRGLAIVVTLNLKPVVAQAPVDRRSPFDGHAKGRLKALVNPNRQGRRRS